MAKLRKMMGSIEDPSIIELMALIETQSKQTLAAWTAAYVKEHFLSIYEAAYPEDKRLQDALAAVEEHLQGKLTLKELTPILKEATQAAKDAEANPTAQAAARAVSTACGTIKTPTNALGFAFYGAAAAAYSQAGLSEAAEVYDSLAVTELAAILDSLKAVAVKDEPNPVKVKWYC